MTHEEVRDTKVPFFVYHKEGYLVKIYKINDGNFDFHPSPFQTIASGEILNDDNQNSQLTVMFFENSKLVTKQDNPEYFI